MSSRFPFSFLLFFLSVFFFTPSNRLRDFFEDEKLRNNPHIYFFRHMTDYLSPVWSPSAQWKISEMSRFSLGWKSDPVWHSSINDERMRSHRREWSLFFHTHYRVKTIDTYTLHKILNACECNDEENLIQWRCALARWICFLFPFFRYN